jgi:S1-C subfamily serine protease
MSAGSASPGVAWRTRWLWLRGRLRAGAPFAGGIAVTLAALLLYTWLFPAPPPLTARDVNEAVAQALASAAPPPAYAAGVYQVIRPALVLIETKTPGEDGQVDEGLGSGVVVSDQGDILTSLHVVTAATDIRLTFADGTQSAGVVMAIQPENDIAVLRATQPPAQLFPATLGNPNAMRVGDEAFAVGNPFGLYSSLSAGVISGFNRSFRPENSSQRIEGLIQIDAAVNPGNSGGPLLNRAGQVIGIVTALVNPTEQEVFIGIGFAVPITVAGGAAGLPPY